MIIIAKLRPGKTLALSGPEARQYKTLFHTCWICLIVSSVPISLIGLSNPATPILKPSKPSSLPFTVTIGARAYALATRLFLSSTITFAQISSSMLSHLSRTSCIWSWNERRLSHQSGYKVIGWEHKLNCNEVTSSRTLQKLRGHYKKW